MRQEPFIPIYDLSDSPPDDESASDLALAPISDDDFIKMLDAVLGAPIHSLIPEPIPFSTYERAYNNMKRGDTK